VRAATGAVVVLITLGVSAGPAGSAAPATCLGQAATIELGPGRSEVRGSSTADVIVASNGSHTIHGRGGNDRICAGGGDDRVLGGGGSDWVVAGPGNDTVEGENGSDRIFGGAGSDAIRGNRGNDRIAAGGGSGDFADAGLGDDSVSGGRGSLDRVIGGVGNDRLEGGPGDEDILRGDHGADYFDGGEGDHDVASFAISGFGGPIQGGQGVIVDLLAGRASQDGNDRLTGIEDVIGTAFKDSMRGSSAANILYGGGGDDQLSGFGKRDRAVAGAGSDSCSGFEQVESCGPEEPVSGQLVEVALAGGRTRGSLTVVGRQPRFLPGGQPAALPTGMSIEVGYKGGDWTVLGGPALTPGEGCAAVAPEVVHCPTANPDAVLVTGDSQSDRLVLRSDLPPTISGVLYGDAGFDTLLGSSADDSLNGGGKEESVPTDFLNGRGGDDALANGRVLLGGSGSDLLIASPCVGQRIDGGPGVDSASFARAFLKLGVQVRIGGKAILPPHKLGGKSFPAGCPIQGSQPTSIDSSIENIEGSPEGDILIGGSGANILLGRGGDDRISGGGGSDFLVGGTGRDEMTGGLGSDRLYARDGNRDGLLRCGPGALRGDVAKTDSTDRPPLGCRVLP
jgi:Ca2+-binding RTX toxin-like protein